jgi:UPF0755 protein
LNIEFGKNINQNYYVRKHMNAAGKRKVKSKPKSKTFKTALIITLGIFFLLLVAAGIKIYEDVFADNINLETNKKGYLLVYTNKSLTENAELIKQNGLLNNTDAFFRFAHLTGYASLIKPGRYEVADGMNNLALLRLLVSGKQTPLDVTFKYAQRKADLVSFWANQLETDSIELLLLLNDSAYCASLGFNSENIVSLFIPNTYNFYWTTSAPKLVKRMEAEYVNFWNQGRIDKLARTKLTKIEVSVLASIVQKETYMTDEMPVVAGAYMNRLRLGMPLQADPTIIFAMNDNSIKRVAGDMLNIQSPYNTYQNKGLPPGPICVPGKAAIDAVLNFKEHKFIYFCAKEDFSGYHNFATNFTQHQKNARKYQKQLNKRGVK